MSRLLDLTNNQSSRPQSVQTFLPSTSATQTFPVLGAIPQTTVTHPRASPDGPQAPGLWFSLHRLGNVLDGVSGQAPAEIASGLPEPSSPWPIPKMPQNQIAYQEWLLTASISIFQCESLPDSPIFSLDAPAVKGLVIYAARCGPMKFYAARVEWTGTFIGWMLIRPAVEGVDSDYGTGEVLGRPLSNRISVDLNAHRAIDRFVIALKKQCGTSFVSE